MEWKQLFTLTPSMNVEEAKNFISNHNEGTYNLLDVRQPGEYGQNHIPGGVLIPLPELQDRAGELNLQKPTIVYCAVGGRSRVAAQILAGKGFKEIYNLSGGIKAWDGSTASGAAETGLGYFSPEDSPTDVIKTAYAMEEGLRYFYEKISQSQHGEAGSLLKKLAGMEEGHKRKLRDSYLSITGLKDAEELERFASEAKIMEGGFNMEDSLKDALPKTFTDVITKAMMLEAQALDLYLRCSRTLLEPGSVKILNTLADDEKTHLSLLGDMMEKTL